MSPRQIDVHPEALAEARAATLWYRKRSASAADAFLSEIDQAVERISEKPYMYPRYAGGTRRYFLKRFPFYVVYREAAGRLEIVAIAHGKRKPGYWKERIARVNR